MTHAPCVGSIVPPVDRQSSAVHWIGSPLSYGCSPSFIIASYWTTEAVYENVSNVFFFLLTLHISASLKDASVKCLNRYKTKDFIQFFLYMWSYLIPIVFLCLSLYLSICLSLFLSFEHTHSSAYERYVLIISWKEWSYFSSYRLFHQKDRQGMNVYCSICITVYHYIVLHYRYWRGLKVHEIITTLAPFSWAL